MRAPTPSAIHIGGRSLFGMLWSFAPGIALKINHATVHSRPSIGATNHDRICFQCSGPMIHRERIRTRSTPLLRRLAYNVAYAMMGDDNALFPVIAMFLLTVWIRFMPVRFGLGDFFEGAT